MKRFFGVILASAVTALLLFGCDFLLGPDAPVGGGNLVIGFGEGGGAARTVTPAEMRYELVLTGPGEQKVEASVPPGGSYTGQVALGEWHIYAEAYGPENALIGTGSADVTVKAGMNEARVRMEVVSAYGINLNQPGTYTFPAVIVGYSTTPAARSVMVNNTGNEATGALTAALSGTNSGSFILSTASIGNIAVGGSDSFTVVPNMALVVGTYTATVTVSGSNGISASFNVSFTVTPPAGALLTPTPFISGVSVPFRYVPAGSFQRDGAAANISHITNGYWMSETEVTQELFQAVMGTNPSNFDGTAGKEPDIGETQNQRPVENVNWYDAIAFCNKLSLLAGKEPVYSVVGITDWAGLAYSAIPPSDNATWNAATMDMSKNGYRLPTEMEWMWAAMGATLGGAGVTTTGYTKAFAGSDGINSIGNYAWYDVNADDKTHEVGKKTANELGLKDMSGNVYEWCWDWYGSYPAWEKTDYTGAGSGTYRVSPGGSWIYNASNCAVASRYCLSPYYKYNDLGFRVVCAP